MILRNRFNRFHPLPIAVALAAVLFCVGLSAAQDLDSAATIRGIDRSVAFRDDNLLGYTVTENYTVFRNGDDAHPAAAMMVKTTYTRNFGKSYDVLSESGSELLRKEVLERILDNEKSMNESANRAEELITSHNYTMTVKGEEMAAGRDCLVLAIVPRRIAPYLFNGKIWVDVRDQAIVRLEGVASKSASMLTGPAQVMRTYAQVDGLPMAAHASATTSSWLLGPTRIEIEYAGYEIRRAPTP